MNNKISILLCSCLLLLLISCENVNLGETYFLTDYGENPKWTPDNERIIFIFKGFYSSGDAILSMDSNSMNTFEIPMDNHNLYIRFISLSKDGKYIAISSEDKGFKMHLYLLPIEGGNLIRLIEAEEGEYWESPTWSPDGQWIYLLKLEKYKEYISTIWKIRPDGTELTKLDNNINKNIYNLNCSNNGEYLVMDYKSNIDSHMMEMMVIRLSDYKIYSFSIVNYRSNHPTFSPDDRWICFSNEGKLCVIPYDNSDDYVRITENDVHCEGYTQPDWSSDGRWIVFVGDHGGIYKVKVPSEFLPK